jgi:hypothetical protein
MSYFSKKSNSKPIYFTDDILEELSEKTGKDKELLADIIKTNLNYVKKSISESDELVLISFPNLGKMRLNYYLGHCAAVADKRGKESTLKAKLNYLKSLFSIEKGADLKNFNKPMVHTLIYNLFKEVPRNILRSFYKSWKILEDKHNKDHEKYFKNH